MVKGFEVKVCLLKVSDERRGLNESEAKLKSNS